MNPPPGWRVVSPEPEHFARIVSLTTFPCGDPGCYGLGGHARCISFRLNEFSRSLRRAMEHA